MKKNLTLSFVVLIFTTSISYGFYFPDKPTRKLFKLAESYFINENYPAALPLYLKLDSMDKENANLNFKIGFCYLNCPTFKTKSIPYFEKAIKDATKKYSEGTIRERQAPLSSFYYLAKAYQLNYEFDKAIALYRKYKTKFGKDKKKKYLVEKGEATYEIQTCKNAIELIKKPVNIVVKNLGEGVNSEYPEYAPVVTIDEKTLIFTTRRAGGTTDAKLPNGQYFEDIYISTADDDGNWSKAMPIGPNINSKRHEASVNITTDGQTLLIYKDDNGDGNLYESQLKGTEWGVPKYEISPVNTQDWETHACFSSDNRILYFVSDRAGGFGGRDIYKCLKLPNGEWGPAQNLGDTINTKYDEDGVFIAPDGKQIYFASKGHNTMGGFDIFTSMIDDENGWWSRPVNFGYPVNTPDDDVFLITSPDGRRAYFSSDQKGGYGEKDIYQITFPDQEPRDLSLVVGKVVNNSNEDISNNKIAIVSAKTNDTLQVVTANSATGKFGANLPVGFSYKIIYTVNNKEIMTENVDCPKGKGYQVLRPLVPYNSNNPVNKLKIKENKDTTGITNILEEEMEVDSSKVIVPVLVSPLISKLNSNSSGTAQKYTTVDTSAAKRVIAGNEIPVMKMDCNPEKSKFQYFFKYNKKDINARSVEFNGFIDALCGCLKLNSSYHIKVEASASRVPTKKYKTNENLANIRAQSGQEKIKKALSKKGFKENQLVFDEPKALVQGPDYKKDAKRNRKKYEQYQYIKVITEVNK